MSHALSIAPRQFARRGACPTLDQPMQTGDGLLARLRISGGRLAPVQLRSIARLALEHGNGTTEITARGNLQVRGLTERSAPHFAAAVRTVVEIERGLVVETPPLAGDDLSEIADPRPLAQAIRGLAEPLAERLGPKVSVVVDGCGQIGLAQSKADIRLTAAAPGRWLVCVGDGAVTLLDTASALEAVGHVLADLAALGPTARASDLTGDAPPKPVPPQPIAIGPLSLRTGVAFAIALPFGSVDAPGMDALCMLAAGAGVSDFRLAPHHGLIAVGADASFADAAGKLGLVTDLADPRLRVSACIGSEGCASGYLQARSLAAGLAWHVAPGKHLHVSGCAKGCAHPRPADVTLVGQAAGVGLVIGGKASDSPQSLLRTDELESALAAR